MTHLIHKFLTLAGLSLIVGCSPLLVQKDRMAPYSEAPIAVNFPAAAQFKMQALQHWKTAAEYAAEELKQSVQAHENCKEGKSCNLIHVRKVCPPTGCAPKTCETAFSKVFHSTLESALSQQGFSLSPDPLAEGLNLDIDIQSAQFAQDRAQFRAAGDKVKLGPGVWALRDVSQPYNIEAERFLEPTSMVLPNWFRSNFATGDTPSYEMLVSISAMNRQRSVVAKTSAVYYFAESDVAHYLCDPPKPPPVPVAPAVQTDKEKRRTATFTVLGECAAPGCASPAKEGLLAASAATPAAQGSTPR